MSVFVMDASKTPLTPCHPSVARKLLSQGKASVFRRFPFTIILKESKEQAAVGMQLKIDPGSRVTGIALLAGNKVLWAAELKHRGTAIKKSLQTRSALRRGRRYRKTRYRHPRFPAHKRNRLSGWNSRPEGWLPPSIMSRVLNVMTWVERLRRLAPVSSISVETVRFDTQKMLNPEISGVEYQRGELWGYEVREYLLEKWGRKCAYCKATNIPLEIEHIVPKAKGGSDRVSNLTLACRKCNEKKGNQTAAEFGFPKLLRKAGLSLRDTAAVNSARKVLLRMLRSMGLPVEPSSGGVTKWNRSRFGLPKTHWLDAVCVGSMPDAPIIKATHMVAIKATGHGVRQRVRTDPFGFPVAHKRRRKVWYGYKTGDIARAIIPPTKKYPEGRRFWGRVTIDSDTNVRLHMNGKRPSAKFEHIKRLHAADGYDYALKGIELAKHCPGTSPGH